MGHGARAVDSSLVTFFVSGCRFVRAREEEPHGNAQHAHLCATRSAPKGRNNEAQANGLGLDYPPIFTPSPERAGYCRTRTALPTASGACGIEKDCSAPSGLGHRFGSR